MKNVIQNIKNIFETYVRIQARQLFNRSKKLTHTSCGIIYLGYGRIQRYKQHKENCEKKQLVFRISGIF